MTAAALSLPGFDPDSADAEILGAFSKLREMQRAAYFKADRGVVDPTLDGQIGEAERGVTLNFATTIPGVIAQLETIVPDIIDDRWVDRGLIEHGLFALQSKAGKVDPVTRCVVFAAFALLHIEWEQALAAYEKAAADFSLIEGGLDIINDLTRAARASGAAGAYADFAKLGELFDGVAEHFTTSDLITRLVRTLTPDWDAYRRKAEIIIAEGFQAEGAVWLVRDVNFLSGRIEEIA